MALLGFFLAFFGTVKSQTYLGCYEDGAERDLTGDLFLNDVKMTPTWCEAQCGKYQYKYFGIQYGNECYCGNTYGKYPIKPDQDCYVKCPGDEDITCGGDFRNSVYQVSRVYKLAPPPTRPPLLALVMMVKDEAHTLPSTLRSLKNYIDYYYILDTGSTDGTQDAIRKVLGNNGEILEEPFVDYGTTRNRVLDIAAQSPLKPIFALMLSADETVYNPDALRAFCEEHRDLSGDDEEGYAVTMDTGQRFASVRLQRVSKGWRYEGKVHEYMTSRDGRHHKTQRVPDAYIRFRATDSWRRLEQQKRILRILEEEKKVKPVDTRVSFYLASSYAIVGDYNASLAEYRRRVSLGGWMEEVYDSMYQIGWQLDNLKSPWAEVQQAWLEAHQYSPDRAEPLYWIAYHYRQKGENHLAFLFALRCSQIPFPKWVQLWVTGDVYEYKCAQIVGDTGLEIKEYEAGVRGMAQTYRALPKDVEVYKKLVQYKSKLNQHAWRTVFPANKPLLPPPDSNLPIELDPDENPTGPGTVENQRDGVTREDTRDATVTKVAVDTDTGDDDMRVASSLTLLTIGLNLLIFSIFIFGFIKVARYKKNR